MKKFVKFEFSIYACLPLSVCIKSDGCEINLYEIMQSNGE